MRTTFFIFQISCLISQVFLLNLVKIDLSEITSKFTRNSDNFKVLIQGTQLPSDTANEITQIVYGITDEHCALECLKSIYCIKYSFNSEMMRCLIILRPDFQRKTSQSSSLEEVLKCNLNSCSSSLYCSTNDSGSSLCLCDSVLNLGGLDCNARVKYEFEADWSTWSTCSQTCGGGFRERSKKCLKKFGTKVEIAADWLCGSTSSANRLYQVEACNDQQCGLYSPWSDWTACSKICGGFRSRARTCLLIDNANGFCDQSYLREINMCNNLDSCQSSVLILEAATGQTINPSNIASQGVLKFMDTVTNKIIKILTQTKDAAKLKTIGIIACREFQFDNFFNIIAIPSTNLDETLNGLKCLGNETSIKDCQNDLLMPNLPLYELAVQCSYKPYWSQWFSWSVCIGSGGVKCGSGVKTRTRYCNDPEPANEADKNAAIASGTCTGRSGVNQFMGRCSMQICKPTTISSIPLK